MKTTRRGFLAALASLPVVGKMVQKGMIHPAVVLPSPAGVIPPGTVIRSVGGGNYSDLGAVLREVYPSRLRPFETATLVFRNKIKQEN
jgi:hypothetical protein